MVAPDPLSEQELTAARTELAAGRPFPVWFTAAAVGVPAGGSAKVVSVGEASEGDFIEVRPSGSRDTVSCSPNELTSTRPPRRKRAAGPEEARPAARTQEPGPRERALRQPPARRSRPEQNGVAPAVPSDTPPDRAPARPRSAGSRPAEVSVTLTSTPDGEWTVEVTTGRKRTVRPTAVQPADVAQAARSLPDAVTEAIESSLAAARQRQAERVERLRAELDAAQRALQDLSG